MERILQSAPFTASETFYEDGTVVDPGTVTVGITRWDGTVLVAAGTATAGSGAAARTFALTAANTALLDTFTVTWTSATKGIRKSTIEVVGDFLFTISQARALKPLNDTTNYTTAQIVAARTLAEQTLEDSCGRAFVPRYTLETLDGNGSTGLLLSWPDVRVVRSVAVAGVAYDSTALAGLAFNASGSLYSLTAVTAGYSNVIVGYEHGTGYPPARVSQAALLLARSWLVTGPVDNRALGAASPDGGFSYGLATPGRNGSWTGVPEVDAVIDQYSLRVGVA